VRHRDLRQPLVGSLAVFVVFPLEDALRGRPAQVPVCAIDVSQQGYVGGSVGFGKSGPLVWNCDHPPRLLIPGDQARHLSPAQTCHLSEVEPDHALVGPRQAGILVSHQGPLHPAVHFLAPLPGKPHPAVGGHQGPELLQTCGLRIVHSDDQSPASRDSPSRLILRENPVPCPGSSCMRKEWPTTRTGRGVQ